MEHLVRGPELRQCLLCCSITECCLRDCHARDGEQQPKCLVRPDTSFRYSGELMHTSSSVVQHSICRQPRGRLRLCSDASQPRNKSICLRTRPAHAHGRRRGDGAERLRTRTTVPRVQGSRERGGSIRARADRRPSCTERAEEPRRAAVYLDKADAARA